MKQINFHRATFLKSAAKLSQLPEDEGIEVAFAGRSNAGKSTAINVLTDQKNLTKTSKTPGRTRLINLFSLDDERRLVDLPGYGYAKVSAAMKKEWQKTLGDYLQQRKCLKGLILLMDSRHPLKPLDQMLIDWCLESELPVHILVTKSDKLNQREKAKSLKQVTTALANQPLITVQLFSSLKRQGLDQLYATLNGWFTEKL